MVWGTHKAVGDLVWVKLDNVEWSVVSALTGRLFLGEVKWKKIQENSLLWLCSYLYL